MEKVGSSLALNGYLLYIYKKIKKMITTTEEPAFLIRSYGKGELAALYLPHLHPRSALASFNDWIGRFPGLGTALQQAGLAANARRYTPAQVKLIVGALGEP